MPTNKRITDLSDYTTVLPYASEMFGVYQPMIGWRSARRLHRFTRGFRDDRRGLLTTLAARYTGQVESSFSTTDCTADLARISIGRLDGPRLSVDDSNLLMRAIAVSLPPDRTPVEDEWVDFLNADVLMNALNTTVARHHANEYQRQCRDVHARAEQEIARLQEVGESVQAVVIARDEALEQLVRAEESQLAHQSALAGALLALVEEKKFAQVQSLFYAVPAVDPVLATGEIAQLLATDDPFATFDPKKDISSVSLSPLGIVHLFRQYFYELDTFLGTPTAHVWLSPGASVELIEVSTRRVYVEKTVEQSTETTQKTETSDTSNTEISDAVKTDNRTDLKLGASLSVNQSWGTGSSTATGSLNMESTQGKAREDTHKRMREQSTKLSSEIKQNYVSTFKTITENTDTSSKRYTLANDSGKLINYELRRKMRQIGVQVQDIGTYLCWETFVDEPGGELGLANHPTSRCSSPPT
jgi:hypothetical protein